MRRAVLDERITKDSGQAIAIVVKVFLQQRDNAVIPGETQLFDTGDSHKVAMANLMVAIEQRGDSCVEPLEQGRHIDMCNGSKHGWLWHYLNKRETSPQGKIQQCNGSISRVHGT
jgi:hypothetical protein